MSTTADGFIPPKPASSAPVAYAHPKRRPLPASVNVAALQVGTASPSTSLSSTPTPAPSLESSSQENPVEQESIPRLKTPFEYKPVHSMLDPPPALSPSLRSISPPPAIPEYSSRRTSIASARGHGFIKGSVTSTASFSSLVSVDNGSPMLSRHSSRVSQASSAAAVAAATTAAAAAAAAAAATAVTTAMPAQSLLSSAGNGGAEDSISIGSSSVEMNMTPIASSGVPQAERKADYATYMRRQKATVWCDRVPKNLITKSRAPTSQMYNTSKRKKDSQRTDEYSTYMHAYAYYQPKLDMTLELSDARVVSNGSSRLAARALGQDEDDSSLRDSSNETAGSRTPLSASALDLSNTSGLFKTSTLLSVNSTDEVGNNNSNSRLSVSSSPASASASARLNLPTTPGATSTTSLSSPAVAPSLSRKSSAGSLDESELEGMIAPRRTLYIANPDYSSSGEE
ncbi:uncharacterized protein V2V93DRAFT_369948 [Kockiozyma suomiensis]|uniref:uncharacterized protein n=1 Tax=Kockiozyma suomiensis TaxID=1337062 RepID=UPI003342F43B